MKRLKVIVLIVVATVGVVILSLGVRRVQVEPKVIGEFQPEDLRGIKQTIYRMRWTIARMCWERGHYARLFRFWSRDRWGASLVEIRSGFGPGGGPRVRVQGPTADYLLRPSTNGWQVVATGFHK